MQTHHEDWYTAGGEITPFSVGPYLLARRVDEGTQSCVAVYEATDTRSNTPVRVKLLFIAGEQDETRQNEQTRRVDHDLRVFWTLTRPPRIQPHLLPLRDLGLFASTPHGVAHYAVMDSQSGETLRERLTRQRELPPKEAGDYLLQIADALDALHAEGVVHGAVRPEAVFFADGTHTRRTAKLMDWGVGCPSDAATPARTDELTGMAAYLAPEQTAGRSTSQSSDVWSLGVVLYEMLAGRAPFAGPNVAETLYRVAFGTAQPIAGLGEMGERVLARALERDPEARYASAGQLARDFRAAIANLPVSAPVASEPVKEKPVVVRQTTRPAPARSDGRLLWACVGTTAFVVGGVLLLRPSAAPNDKTKTPTPRPTVKTGIVSASPVVSATPIPKARPTRVAAIPAVRPSPSVLPSGVVPSPAAPEKTRQTTPDLQVARPTPSPAPLRGYTLPPTPAPTTPTVTEALPGVPRVRPNLRGPVIARPRAGEPAEPAPSTTPVLQPPLPSAPSVRPQTAPPIVSQPEPAAEPPRVPQPIPKERIAPEETVTGETLSFKGTWRGVYDSRPATLTVDKQNDEKGTFSGVVAVQTEAGPVKIAVTGHLNDTNGEPLLELREERVLLSPRDKTWRLSRASGVLTAGGEMRSTNTERTWSFAR